MRSPLLTTTRPGFSRLVFVLTFAWTLLTVWPTWTPFHRDVITILKVHVWTHSYVAISVVVGILALRFAYALHTRRFHVARDDVLVISLCLGVLVLVYVYVDVVLGEAAQIGDEWMLRLCLTYCTSPWRQCRVDPRVISPGGFRHVESARAFVMERVLGQADSGAKERIVVRTRLRPDDPIALEIDGSPRTVPSGTRRLLICYVAPGSSLAAQFDSVLEVPSSMYDRCTRNVLSNGAFVLNAVADAVRDLDPLVRVSVYGCSFHGKMAFIASATASTPYEIAFIDSGGTAVSSFRTVGRCGETLEAMRERHPTWLNADVPLDLDAWPGDAGDLLSHCSTTHFVFTTSPHDLWNNGLGLETTAASAARFNCSHVVLTGTYATHCPFI